MKEELAGWGVGSVLTVERRKERKFGERSFGGGTAGSGVK